MGMYTELYLSCSIKKDTPQEVVNILKYLFGEWDKELYANGCPFPKPIHQFFDCPRWGMVGRCSSYYFAPEAMSMFKLNDINKGYTLITRSDLKNYNNEIALFLLWLNPFIDACKGDHLGHIRYEEDEEPTIIYYTKGL